MHISGGERGKVLLECIEDEMKGDRRGVIISVFVSYERCKLRDDDTRSTRILPIPASLVY